MLLIHPITFECYGVIPCAVLLSLEKPKQNLFSNSNAGASFEPFCLEVVCRYQLVCTKTSVPVVRLCGISACFLSVDQTMAR